MSFYNDMVLTLDILKHTSQIYVYYFNMKKEKQLLLVVCFNVLLIKLF